MELPAQLKSKKVLLLGVAAVVVILVGFFLFKFMTSGAADVVPDRARSAPRARKPISKPEKQKPEKSPLFESLEAWKDPFRGEDPKLAELQDKINTTKKEIEFLKVSLEEKKLRQEIKELQKSMKRSAGEENRAFAAEKKGEVKPQEKVLVKAILITDDEKSALIIFGDQKTWVHEGEEFDGWEIKEITKDSVVLLRAGKTFVFFCDRPHITREGES
jgi:hypothetical protein